MKRLASPDPWAGYRNRRRLFWIAFIGFLPGVAALGLSLNWLSGSSHPATIVAVVWMVFFAITVIRLNGFPCPNCGKPFFHRFFVQNPLSRRCMHCGWPKWVPGATTANGQP